MNMTREEAIKALRIEGVEIGGEAKRLVEFMVALDVAQKALRPVIRERVEKVWRGEWKPTEFPYMNECEDCSVCGYRTPWGHGFRFCPACGAAQTGEAVQMVMERIETLHD